MDNPYEFILDNHYDDDVQGMDAAAMLVLRIMADNYAGDMPAGGTCCDTVRWCLAQFDKYRPNDLIDWMERNWGQAAPSLD